MLYGLYGVLGYYVCRASFATMTAISVDGLMALRYHMRYRTLVSDFRVKCILGGIWPGTMFPCTVMYIWNRPSYITNHNPSKYFRSRAIGLVAHSFPRRLRSRKTVRHSEQKMSADKYPSIFSHRMEDIVYIAGIFIGVCLPCL